MNACGALTTDSTPAVATRAGTATANGTIFHFEQGLFGFPDDHDFVLMATPHPAVFRLQSTNRPELAFLVADPFAFFKGYWVDLPDTDVKRLGASRPEDVAILVTVTFSADPGRASTANLQAPIAINVRTRRCRQAILIRSGYGVREAVDLSLDH